MESRLGLAEGEAEGVGWLGSLGQVDTNLHLEWMSNEVLLLSTGSYVQSLVMKHDDR